MKHRITMLEDKTVASWLLNAEHAADWPQFHGDGEVKNPAVWQQKTNNQ